MSKPSDPTVINRAQPPQSVNAAETVKLNVIRKINRLLIANRGEIACRIIATARRLHIETVAVYSDADRNAKHVSMADQAMCIGPSAARGSYLNINALLVAANAAHVDAIHPGYGFLSENAGFAAACHKQGFLFIGPSAESINTMGSKSDAKNIMEKANVPLIPGYHGDSNQPDILLQQAEKIGYPVLLKAALGGGGKGMRIVNVGAEMLEAIASAKREAMAAFGDNHLLVEKYLINPRHIEVQIFADQHGNTVYLLDRDCSIQRRHQKIVEEAPAPGLSESLRRQMGEAAVNAARAINYTGAGTIEFLLEQSKSDPSGSNHGSQFYFMEMNTRLQVEHPVTELITGQDLVEWQIRVAEGHPLPLRQHQIVPKGNAIEVRVYAEDPDNGFLPEAGTITYLREPEPNRHLRIDSGIQHGDTVTSYYDPMLAKVISWGENRTAAIYHLKQALAQYRLIGLKSNIQYLHQLVSHPAFAREEISTAFIEQHQNALLAQQPSMIELTTIQPDTAPAVLIAKSLLFSAVYLLHPQQKIPPGSPQHCSLQTYRQVQSPWAIAGWRMNQPASQTVCLQDRDGHLFELTFELSEQPKKLSSEFKLVAIKTNNQQHRVSPLTITHIPRRNTHSPNQIVVELCQRIDAIRQQEKFTAIQTNNQIDIFYQASHDIYCSVVNGYIAKEHKDKKEPLTQAPMNGVISAIYCKAGEKVNKDQPLLIIEAMKMEYTVKAPYDGVIESVRFTTGDQVEHGQQLLNIERTVNTQ
ncbi:acetyl/propionyl/methylcrotonyl-CoA carboxylase subunit alpha [Photobacterium lipolyticum]|uniref:Biotin carboxylase n=1 Tax=Photobacterium lipolyticum TaxID=266810 RepID=A0A2T3MZW0_9GAMM|nr:biotin carboxylase N-terminal domain-containing protein [Photobacterium lipolyticum]PSW05425.1 3-methylcrotonyl-CoA carboxylase [Photobacterium lipolyticum]